VVSGHSWSDPYFYNRILGLGGIAGPYGNGTDQFVSDWKTLRATANYPGALGVGFDTGGFGAQAPPRADAATRPLQYPFQTFDGGSTVDKQRTGDRVFDLNVDGMAHIGLMPDWLADLRMAAGPDADAIIHDMSRGAEAYLDTWKATEDWG
jgi:hypothetical protein